MSRRPSITQKIHILFCFCWRFGSSEICNWRSMSTAFENHILNVLLSHCWNRYSLTFKLLVNSEAFAFCFLVWKKCRHLLKKVFLSDSFKFSQGKYCRLLSPMNQETTSRSGAEGRGKFPKRKRGGEWSVKYCSTLVAFSSDRLSLQHPPWGNFQKSLKES